MNYFHTVRKETALVAALEILASALTVLVFALIGKLSSGVWIGAGAGALLAILNYFLMAVAASRVTEKAVLGQEDQKGQGIMRGSYILLLVLIFVILVLIVKLGWADPIPAVIPLLLMQPIILFTQYLCQKAVK